MHGECMVHACVGGATVMKCGDVGQQGSYLMVFCEHWQDQLCREWCDLPLSLRDSATLCCVGKRKGGWGGEEVIGTHGYCI